MNMSKATTTDVLTERKENLRQNRVKKGKRENAEIKQNMRDDDEEEEKR